MKQANRKHTLLRAGIAVLVVGLLGRAETASAAAVYVNHDDVTYTATSTSAGFKYRISHTNFDMSLDNGNTSASVNMITNNLGNKDQLTGQTYNFEVRNIAGQGLVFKMTNQATGAVSTQAWGTFSSPTGATGNQLVSSLNGITPDRSFNSLFLEARATALNSTFTFSNLDFTSDGVGEFGDGFFGGMVTPSTGLNGAPNGFARQRLVADFDLSDVNFTLTGTLRGTRVGTSGDENVRFTIFAQQGTAAGIPPPALFVPEPGGAGLVMSGLSAMLMMRRRA